MSAARERFLLIVVVNVIIAAGVVGAAFALFVPGPRAAGPRDSAVAREVDALRRDMDTLRESLAEAIRDREALRSEVGALTARLETVEKVPRGLGALGALASGEAGAGEDGAQPSAEERMMQGIAAMMKSRIQRERDRFIEDVMNPTERSRERQKRGIAQGMRFIRDRLDLDDAQTAEVTRVLTEVDNLRRNQLRTLMEAKESPEDVEYDEVKKILDESFVEEDRMIEQVLPTEKAEEYKESAGAFRQLVYGAAKMAFPEKKEEQAAGGE